MPDGVAVHDDGVVVGDNGVHVDSDTEPCCCSCWEWIALGDIPSTLSIDGYTDGDIPASDCAQCDNPIGGETTWDGTYNWNAGNSRFEMDDSTAMKMDGRRVAASGVTGATITCEGVNGWILRHYCIFEGNPYPLYTARNPHYDPRIGVFTVVTSGGDEGCLSTPTTLVLV